MILFRVHWQSFEPDKYNDSNETAHQSLPRTTHTIHNQQFLLLFFRHIFPSLTCILIFRSVIFVLQSMKFNLKLLSSISRNGECDATRYIFKLLYISCGCRLFLFVLFLGIYNRESIYFGKIVLCIFRLEFSYSYFSSFSLSLALALVQHNFSLILWCILYIYFSICI